MPFGKPLHTSRQRGPSGPDHAPASHRRARGAHGDWSKRPDDSSRARKVPRTGRAPRPEPRNNRNDSRDSKEERVPKKHGNQTDHVAQSHDGSGLRDATKRNHQRACDKGADRRKNSGNVEAKSYPGRAQACWEKLRKVRRERSQYSVGEQAHQRQQDEKRLIVLRNEEDDRQHNHVADRSDGECRPASNQFSQPRKYQKAGDSSAIENDDGGAGHLHGVRAAGNGKFGRTRRNPGLGAPKSDRHRERHDRRHDGVAQPGMLEQTDKGKGRERLDLPAKPTRLIEGVARHRSGDATQSASARTPGPRAKREQSIAPE